MITILRIKNNPSEYRYTKIVYSLLMDFDCVSESNDMKH